MTTDVAAVNSECQNSDALDPYFLPALVHESISSDAAVKLAGALKALANPARLRLLSLVQTHEAGEACVHELTERLGLTQPTVSHHLKVLHEAGLVSRRKETSWVYYRANPESLAALANIVSPSDLSGRHGSSITTAAIGR